VQWTDRAALAAHFAVPASIAFVKTASALSDGRPSIQIYEATPAASGARNEP
jgi:quinol monooxygenase YgiN